MNRKVRKREAEEAKEAEDAKETASRGERQEWNSFAIKIWEVLCLQGFDDLRLCVSFAIRIGEETKRQGGTEAGKERQRKLQNANLCRLEMGPIVCFL